VRPASSSKTSDPTVTAPRPDVTVVTSGHDVADARLHRVCAGLLREGLSVEVLGLGDPADAPAGVAVRVSARGGMVQRALLAFRYAVRARGRVLLALDPDSLVSSLVVGRLRRRAVVADVHEDYAALLRDRVWARGWRGSVAALLTRGATAAARVSDLVVVADEHVPPLSAPARLVVRNLPDLRMLPAPSPRSASPRALYVGDVRGSRGLWAMLTAVEEAPGWTLDVVGPVAPSDAERLTAELSRRGLDDRVRLHGRQPPAAAWQWAQGAWCGLGLLDDTAAFRDALPSKLFEYVGCGLAVVVTDLPRQRDFVHPGADDAVGEAVPPGEGAGSAAAVVLRDWAQDTDRLDTLRAASLARRSALLEQDPYAELAVRVRELTQRRR
jgi:glycosyltransferase involved in cell wall biosynthesis